MPSHSYSFCNNKGGVGKTFMAFQTACEAARARPDKSVLVVDFSLYSDITALLLGGSSRAMPGAPMKGLQASVELTTPDTRVEGLIRDLENAMDVEDEAPAVKASGSIFGAFFKPREEAKQPAGGGSPLDLQKYMLRPADRNPAIPGNLYLIPSAGMESWGRTTTGGDDVPLWARKGDEWWPAAQRLRRAVDALPDTFDAVFFDTDHLAACVLTKLALAAAESVILPLSFDDGDFNRLFQDVTENALLSDVMIDMDTKNQLRARIQAMVFTRVDKTANKPCQTPEGICSPFTPTKTTMNAMDNMAQQMWAACMHDERYKRLFRDNEEIGQSRGFASTYFRTFKLVPDLAANISKMNGLPVCAMTSETYVAPSGLTGKSDKGALDALKAELQDFCQGVLSEAYNKPLIPS